MNAEQMELARRFVACKGWVWLPGMQAVLVVAATDERVESARSRFVHDYCDDLFFRDRWREVHRGHYAIALDLSDALTRAGLLEVVRRAIGDPDAYVRPSTKGGYVLCSRVSPGGPTRGEPPRGPSELHAMLAALEAAPGV